MWSNTATLQTEADDPRRTNLYQNMVPNPPLLPSAVSKLGSINRNQAKSIKRNIKSRTILTVLDAPQSQVTGRDRVGEFFLNIIAQKVYHHHDSHFR
jgi:hypothetical protein